MPDEIRRKLADEVADEILDHDPGDRRESQSAQFGQDWLRRDCW